LFHADASFTVQKSVKNAHIKRGFYVEVNTIGVAEDETKGLNNRDASFSHLKIGISSDTNFIPVKEVFTIISA